jgi:hypothetical protein
LDWNLESIKQGDDLLSKILRFLNHYHLPAPAVRILPSVIWYGVKF